MLQSIIEQKIAIAAYGSENNIMVLNQTQLDLAVKIIKVLEPIEEITKPVPQELAYISVICLPMRALPFLKPLAKMMKTMGCTE